MGGIICTDVREPFQGGRAGSPTIWIRDVGGDPPNHQDTGRVTTKDVLPSDREVTLEDE